MTILQHTDLCVESKDGRWFTLIMLSLSQHSTSQQKRIAGSMRTVYYWTCNQDLILGTIGNASGILGWLPSEYALYLSLYLKVNELNW